MRPPRVHSYMRLAIVCLSFALPAFAQVNSAALRAKYGPPLDREIFHMPGGFDLTVEPRRCKLQVPALLPSTESVRGTPVMRQRILDFLADLVPVWMRGNKLRDFSGTTGASVILLATEYEYVTINEVQYTEQARGDSTIPVTFKNGACAP